MKRKFLVFMMALFLLAGCSRMSVDFSSEVRQIIQNSLQQEMIPSNYNNPYYSYYLAPNVGRIYADGTSNIFSYYGVQFVMNLNISNVIFSHSDRSILPTGGHEPYFDMDGEFVDTFGDFHDYLIQVYEMNPKEFITYVSSDFVSFYSVSTKNEIPELVGEMIKIARSIQIDEEEIFNHFSTQQVILNERKQLELFQNITPENGVIDELFDVTTIIEGEDNNVSFSDNYATDNFPDTPQQTQTTGNGDYSEEY